MSDFIAMKHDHLVPNLVAMGIMAPLKDSESSADQSTHEYYCPIPDILITFEVVSVDGGMYNKFYPIITLQYNVSNQLVILDGGTGPTTLHRDDIVRVRLYRGIPESELLNWKIEHN